MATTGFCYVTLVKHPDGSTDELMCAIYGQEKTGRTMTCTGKPVLVPCEGEPRGSFSREQVTWSGKCPPKPGKYLVVCLDDVPAKAPANQTSQAPVRAPLPVRTCQPMNVPEDREHELRIMYTHLKASFDQTQQELARQQGTIFYLNDELAKNKKMYTELQDWTNDVDAQSREHEGRATTLASENAALQRKLEVAELTLGQIRKIRDDLLQQGQQDSVYAQERARHRETVEELEQKLEQAREMQKLLSAESKCTVALNYDLRTKLTNCQSTVVELQAELVQANQEGASHRPKKTNPDRQLQLESVVLRREISELQGSRTEYEKIVGGQQTYLDELRQAYTTLQEEYAALEQENTGIAVHLVQAETMVAEQRVHLSDTAAKYKCSTAKAVELAFDLSTLKTEHALYVSAYEETQAEFLSQQAQIRAMTERFEEASAQLDILPCEKCAIVTSDDETDADLTFPGVTTSDDDTGAFITSDDETDAPLTFPGAELSAIDIAFARAEGFGADGVHEDDYYVDIAFTQAEGEGAGEDGVPEDDYYGY